MSMGNIPLPPAIPPPPVAGPTNGKPVTAESAPKVEPVRVGIEIEGVGTIRTQWSRASVIDQDNFHDVFKRMKLVRSNSFGSTRGVYVTPEDAEDTFGTQSPAELVSSPHLFTPAALVHLFNSVWKVFTPKGMMTGKATFSDPRLPSNQSKPTATSRFGKHTMAAVGGSLQTTIGVCVEKLLADAEGPRLAVVRYLVGDATLEGYVLSLTGAAVAAQEYLTASRDRPLFGITAAERYGVRLALFLAFVNSAVESVSVAEGGKWSKSRLSCIFKGQSSFTACGVKQGNAFLRVGLAAIGKNITDAAHVAAFKADLINGIKAITGETWATRALASDGFNPKNIGAAGQSVQTSVEGWYAFPNFFHEKKLYTVVECRKKTAGLNVAMAAFLNTKGMNKRVAMSAMLKPENQATVLGAATTFCTRARSILSG